VSDRLLIGTYTEDLPHVAGRADGILGCTFAGGELSPPATVARVRNPSWVAVRGDRAYAAVETDDGELAGFRQAPDGTLEPLGAVPTGGAHPCHVALDPSGRFAVAANYSGGSVAVVRLDDDGAPVERTALVAHRGEGPVGDRQEGPHPHQVAFVPGTADELLVTDLGADVLVRYRLTEDGRLDELGRIAAPPGSGPRHVAFHPDGIHLFVVCELACSVLVLRGLDHVATLEAVSGDAGTGSISAAIQVAPSGRSVLVTNRGRRSDDVVLFGFDGETLHVSDRQGSQGATPRDLALSPDGRWALVANQDGSTVASFALDEERGRLELAGVADVPTPVSLVFL
jgi:6-phosphogluconolactonase